MNKSLANDDVHKRPSTVSDQTVAAVGQLSEALEWIERARGDLYEFHQKLGHADELFAEAADKLEQAGHNDISEHVKTNVVGRNVLPGRWTFQIVEEFNDGYYQVVTQAERKARDELLAGKRHVYESELKEERRTKGRPGHEATPQDV